MRIQRQNYIASSLSPTIINKYVCTYLSLLDWPGCFDVRGDRLNVYLYNLSESLRFIVDL